MPLHYKEMILMDESEELKELQSIKRLMVLMLVKSGATSAEIGDALSIDSSTVRKMFSFRNIKRAKED